MTIAQGNLRSNFFASLLEYARQGRALEAMSDGWELLDFRAHDELTEKELGVWDAVADHTRQSPAIASSVTPDSFATLVLSATGKVLALDPNFALWLGSPTSVLAYPEVTTMLRLTRSGRACRRLIDDRSGRPILVAGLEQYAGLFWPLSEAAQSALKSDPQAICLVAFAPTRSGSLLENVRSKFDLTPSEAKLAIALLQHDSLEEAAEAVGNTETTANGYRKTLFKKVGVKRRSELVQIVLEIGHRERCNDTTQTTSALREMFGLSSDQMAILDLLAQGSTIPEAAKSLKMNIHTARDHVRAMFEQVGVNKQSELVRVVLEHNALVTLSNAGEVNSNSASDLMSSTRVIRRDTGGLIYLADYGPKNGVPVLLFHAGLGTRRVAPNLLRRSAKAGLRIICIERPGFGGTDLRPEPGYEGSSLDTVFVLDKLGIEKAIVASIGGGNIAALSFAQQFPKRVKAGLMINPTPPRGHELPKHSPATALRRMIFSNPGVIRAVATAFRNQTRSDLLDGVLDQYFSTCEADRAAMAIPEIRALQRASTQAAVARTIEGFVREEEVFAKSWTIPALDCGPWTALVGLDDHTCDASIAQRIWRKLPGFAFVPVADAGRMIMVSRDDMVVATLVALAEKMAMPSDPVLESKFTSAA